jgi:large subunit ribosomal protein L1
MELKQALDELKKEEKRNFDQSIDLIINLKGIDVKRDNINVIVNVPHKVKDKNICGFFTKKSSLVKTITDIEFPKYKDKKELKNLVKNFDFFIAEAKLMPSVATNFGKVLGPTGKMPSPQLGILPNPDDNAIKAVLEKINSSLKIKVKEASVKVVVGKQKMKEEQVIENIEAIYKGLMNALPIKKDNIKNVMVKLTMSKPIVVEMK